MENNKYDLIVIGAGSAGLTLAIGGSQLGAKVLLIEKHKIGGDCTHYGCVPSKSLIALSKDVKIIKKYDKKYKVDLKNILKKVQKTIDSVYIYETPDKIEKLGVDVEIGAAKFISKQDIKVNNKVYFGKKIVIATGSRARIPEIIGLDKIKYMTNKEIFNPTTYKTITIIGGGPIGSELAQAFNNLGIKVNLINSRGYILSREDKNAAILVQNKFVESGINVINDAQTSQVKKENGKIIVFYENKLSKKKIIY